jgi:hypothetical protein
MAGFTYYEIIRICSSCIHTYIHRQHAWWLLFYFHFVFTKYHKNKSGGDGDEMVSIFYICNETIIDISDSDCEINEAM